MSRETDVFVLFNPTSGRGTGAKRIEYYLPRLQERLGPVDYRLTEYAGHEREILDEALTAGYTTIIAAGGDGTWSAAADRIMQSGRGDVTLGLLPAGTGNDFGKSVGVHVDTVDAVMDAIANRSTRRIDMGRVGERYFLNVVGMGFDIAVIDDAETTPLLKGDALYRFCALKQLFFYDAPAFALRDGAGEGDTTPRRHLMLTISNANYFGGSFHIAPRASLEDGMLDAVSISDAGPIGRAKLFDTVSKGKHEAHPRVVVRQHARFEIEYEGSSIRYEVDGDVYEWSDGPLVVESVPDALTIFSPRS
jgi:diacylglycerol kinase (ATP)